MVELGFNQTRFSLPSPNLLVVLRNSEWIPHVTHGLCCFRFFFPLGLQPARGPGSPAVGLPPGTVGSVVIFCLEEELWVNPPADSSF